jgi:hypothetical protein
MRLLLTIGASLSFSLFELSADSPYTVGVIVPRSGDAAADLRSDIQNLYNK